jgi:starch phosphorylase
MITRRRPNLPRKPSVPAVPNVRTGVGAAEIRQAFLDTLLCGLGRLPAVATDQDRYAALAMTIRDRVLEQGVRTKEAWVDRDARTVAYLSAEFLPGPHLMNNLLGLGIEEATREAMAGFSLDLDRLAAVEEEPGLGNGGLGRLASCYLDSLATLEVPAIGYGIGYEFGIFDQAIRDGWQVEVTDKWLRYGNPWEVARPEIAFGVGFGGRTESFTDGAGRYRVRWIPDHVVQGMAFDTPILGYRVGTCNPLRLWRSARRSARRTSSSSGSRRRRWPLGGPAATGPGTSTSRTPAFAR